MPSLRDLRRGHSLTLVELALRAGIPTRTLAAVEYGFQVLDTNSRTQRADIVRVAAELLVVEDPAGSTPSINSHYVRALIIAPTGALLLPLLLVDRQGVVGHLP